MSTRRPRSQPVAVTGMAAVTPAGGTARDLWDAFLAARPTAGPVTRFDTSGHAVRIGCQAPDLQAPPAVSPKQFRRMDRFAQLALTAALDAVADAGPGDVPPGRVAVVVGNAVGGRATSDAESARYAHDGPRAVSPLMPVMTMPNAAAAMISIALGSTGPVHTLATTCASGADAIGYGRALLAAGIADVVVAGGCEATLTPVTMAAFAALGALSGRNDDPAAASRPFDAARDGFVMGEGAAFVVLEREEDARARGARSHGVVLGYGCSSDAHHLTVPHPAGAGAAAAMRMALADAGVAPADVGHVNTHGTSTPLNDAVEAAALVEVFGTAPPPATALKGVTGHLLAASGVAEAITTLQAVAAGTVPPVANHTTTDPACPIDVVHGTARSVAPAPALSNSFGFGGHNASLVLR